MTSSKTHEQDATLLQLRAMLCALYQADNEHTAGKNTWRGHCGKARAVVGAYR